MTINRWTAWRAGMALGVCLIGCATANAAAGEPDFDVSLSLQGKAVRGTSIVDGAGRETWHLDTDPSRGAKVDLTQDGGLIFAVQTFSESTATLTRSDGIASADYVFETRFTLSQPELFIGHMLFISPRVGVVGAGSGYRISYQFLMPGPFSNNSTGFYLHNTRAEAYKKDPYYSTPLAGARYRLAYGREYTACTVVRDVPNGVNIRFFLHDPTSTDDDKVPLIDYTDTSAIRLVGGGKAVVQIGSGGVIYPAAAVRFRNMRIYSADRLDERRAANHAEPPPTISPSRAPGANERAVEATELPNVISDRMVVQRNKHIPIWGCGITGDVVTVRLAGRTARAPVIDGRWRAVLGPLAAGGPYTLTVIGRDKSIAVRNVLVGEVWVLGGQSNMSWWLESTTEAKTEVPRANYPDIRFFSGWHPASDHPQFHLAGGAWKAVAPALLGRFSAVGYYFAKDLHKRLRVPIGLLDTSTPATGIEVWMSEKAAESTFAREPRPAPGQYPTTMGDWAVFFNGKVAPVAPTSVAGVLWYQGDGSSPELGYAYRYRIPSLIRCWRETFGRSDLPFFLVQIPRFSGCSPEMRESQLLSVLHTRNSGLAVTLDVGDPNDIHPGNKRPMGERLALIARAKVYGEKIEYMGPIYRKMEIKGDKAYLSFSHCGTGLVLHGSGGFEVRSAGGTYVPAEVALSRDGRVVVWSRKVARPVSVRYAWATVPAISLYNRDGLLASPFRTRED